MRRQVIPNDNSCLFTAIDYLLENEFRPDAARELRSECIKHIKGNPDIFPELYLGKPLEEYCDWLALDFSWGGEVEIQILSELKNIFISVVQLNSLSVLTYSPPVPTKSKGRIYILYTGQHYDAIVGEDEQKLFIDPNEFDYFEGEAINCARRYKDVREKELLTRCRKRLKCSGCQAILNNADEFQIHCEQVDHDDDFCYECEDIEVTEMVESPDDN